VIRRRKGVGARNPERKLGAPRISSGARARQPDVGLGWRELPLNSEVWSLHVPEKWSEDEC